MVSTVILLGLAAAACSYARLRLVALVERVERDIAEQRRGEAALRQAERTAALAALGRELSGTLDPTQVAQRTVDSIAPSAPGSGRRALQPRTRLRRPRRHRRPAARFSRASPPGRS